MTFTTKLYPDLGSASDWLKENSNQIPCTWTLVKWLKWVKELLAGLCAISRRLEALKVIYGCFHQRARSANRLESPVATLGKDNIERK